MCFDRREERIGAAGSVFFYSLHKCATSFFTHSILPHTQYLRHIDYQTDFYLNKSIAMDIRREGYVYGVLRVVDENHPVFDITQCVLECSGQSGCATVVLVRHPLDILVSMYFSFGFSHGLSPNGRLRKYQEERRAVVEKMSIDDYVLEEASILKWKFDVLNWVASQDDCVVLRYEDLINNFTGFYNSLSSVLPLEQGVVTSLFEQTRPRQVEEPSAHKRSGKVFAYREKLADQTVRSLLYGFSDILRQFDYPLDEGRGGV